jgi:hypothetical protein
MTHLSASFLAAGQVHLPTAVLVAAVVLGALELALLLIALIHLVRHPHPQLLPLWGWLLIIVLLNVVGPLVYLAVGRERRADAPPEPVEPAGDRARRAVDVLYGRPADPNEPPASGGDEGGKE